MFPAAAHFFIPLIIIVERSVHPDGLRRLRGRVNTRVRKKHGLPPHGRTTVGNKRGITDTQPNKATDRQWEEEEEEEEAAEGENF